MTIISNGSAISDPQIEMLRIDVMRTGCTGSGFLWLWFSTEISRSACKGIWVFVFPR